MSIRDRLQGLVELLENKENPDDKLVDEIEKIEELLASEEEEIEEEVEEIEIPDELEVTEEEMADLRSHQGAMSQVELLIGQLTANYEFQKMRLLKGHSELQKALQDEVERLKVEKGLPEEVQYSFTFPEGDVKKGIFKKEE